MTKLYVIIPLLLDLKNFKPSEYIQLVVLALAGHMRNISR